MIDFIYATLASYILTVILVNSSILAVIRNWARLNIKILTISGTFLGDCRLCVGFYVSAAVVFYLGGSVADFLSVYALSYFLAMQERS